MTTTAPPRPTSAPARPMTTRLTAKKFTITSGRQKTAERVVIYGEGGIGKSELVSLLPNVVSLDVEMGTNKIDTRRIPIDAWTDVLEALREPSLWNGIESICIDTATSAQQLAAKHILKTRPPTTGVTDPSIQSGYEWGKGYEFLYESFNTLLAECDNHVRAGRNIILLCHDTTEKVPNPAGTDFLQYQPDLFQYGKVCHIRDRVKGWCDHLLFLQYDIAVNKDGKVKGGGSRTIYPQAQATFWAKSRKLQKPIVFAKGDAALWTALFQQEA